MFSYEYGFYCLEVIAMAIMVGALIENNAFEEAISMMVEPPIKQSPNALVQLFIQAHDPVVRPYLCDEYSGACFDSSGTFETSLNSYLCCVGGMSLEDISFLVDSIWDDRKNFLTIQSLANTTPDWTYMMMFFWLANSRSLWVDGCLHISFLMSSNFGT